MRRSNMRMEVYTSLVIGKVQIKTAVRYHGTPTQTAHAKTTNSTCGRHYGVPGFYTLPVRMETDMSILWKHMAVSSNVKHIPNFVPSQAAQRYLAKWQYSPLKKLNMNIHKHFTDNGEKNWKQSKCLSKGEQTIYRLFMIMEYISTIQTNYWYILITTWRLSRHYTG